MSHIFTLEDAVAFARTVEAEISKVGWHCALAGSCLHAGRSSKDVDLIVYPHKKTGPHCPNKRGLHGALRRAGLDVWMTRRQLRANWKKRGIRDNKWVEVWVSHRGRVDILVLS